MWHTQVSLTKFKIFSPDRQTELQEEGQVVHDRELLYIKKYTPFQSHFNHIKTTDVLVQMARKLFPFSSLNQMLIKRGKSESNDRVMVVLSVVTMVMGASNDGMTGEERFNLHLDDPDEDKDRQRKDAVKRMTNQEERQPD